MKQSIGFWFGVICLAIIVVGVVGASVLIPAGPNVGDISARFTPPAWMVGGSLEHPLGTDHLGRDMLARLLYGGRISIAIGVGAVLLSGSVGVIAGLFSGYIGGFFDILMMRFIDMQLAIPFLALAILVAAALGSGVSNVVLVLAISGWVLYARIIRASVLSAREFDYVLAARAVGATTTRILFRTILPNVFAPALVIATLSVSQMIITESSLSFLGMGVPPATPTWGTMLSDARDYLNIAWWVPTFPGLAITLTVLSANLIGDRMRDRFDPRLNV